MDRSRIGSTPIFPDGSCVMSGPSWRLTMMLLLVLLTGGCLSQSPGEQPHPTQAAHESRDARHAVLFENDWNQTVEIHVEISGENGTVLDRTYEPSPNASWMIYNLSKAADGDEAFAVDVTLGNTTESVVIKTNHCYGPVLAWISEDGSLELTYGIC